MIPFELRLIEEKYGGLPRVNYYQPLRVAAPRYAPNPASPLLFEQFYEPYVMPGRKINSHRGWKSMSKACMTVPKISRKTMAVSSGS